MTTVMFLGMSLCLPLAYLEEHRARKGALSQAEEPLLGAAQEVRPRNGCLEDLSPRTDDLLAELTKNASVAQILDVCNEFVAGRGCNIDRRSINHTVHKCLARIFPGLTESLLSVQTASCISCPRCCCCRLSRPEHFTASGGNLCCWQFPQYLI